MSESDAPAPTAQPLQFDRAIDATAPLDTGAATAVCQLCQTPIASEYYQVNGAVLCPRCKDVALATLATPRGGAPFLRATLFGLGAAILGAAIYYGVIALTNFEIGIVAILIGYLVGKGVRRGARGGGRRYQLLAVALTYLSVGMAYAPLAMRGATERASGAATAIAAILMVFSLPVIAVVSSMPSGLLSALIIGIGLRQAWQMTAAPAVSVTGPLRVGMTASGAAT